MHPCGTLDRDLAALLAIEAHRLDPGTASRSALFGTFTHAPGFEGYVSVPAMDTGGTSIVVTPDSTRAFMTGYDGVVHVIDLGRHADTGETFPDPGFTDPAESRLAISADGTLLAQISGGREAVGSGDNWLVLYDVGARAFRVRRSSLADNMGDVAISPDRRGWPWPEAHSRWSPSTGPTAAETIGSVPRTCPPLDSKLLQHGGGRVRPSGPPPRLVRERTCAHVRLRHP